MCELLWVSREEIQQMNLANCKGEVGPIDMFIMPPVVEPGPNTVCLTCYQIFGQPDGVKEEDLVKFEQILASYKESK